MSNTMQLWPGTVYFPTSNFPQLTAINTIPCLAFDASTAEECFFPFLAPQGFTGTPTVIGHYIMASATSGKVDFECRLEAITPGDATDLDSATSFDTANTITAPTVPGTAGQENTWSCTMTNNDSMAAGDWCVLGVKRDAADGTNDTATGDCYLIGLEFRWG